MGHEYTNEGPPHSCIGEKFVDGPLRTPLSWERIAVSGFENGLSGWGVAVLHSAPFRSIRSPNPLTAITLGDRETGRPRMGHEYTNEGSPHSCIGEKFVDGPLRTPLSWERIAVSGFENGLSG